MERLTRSLFFTPTPEVGNALNSGVAHSYQVFPKIGMGDGRDSHVQE